MAQPLPASVAAVAEEMELCKRVIQAHRNSVVRIYVKKRDPITQRVYSTSGTGFIIHMDPGFCLLMTYAHVLRHHIHREISVLLDNVRIGASVVLCLHAFEYTPCPTTGRKDATAHWNHGLHVR